MHHICHHTSAYIKCLKHRLLLRFLAITTSSFHLCLHFPFPVLLRNSDLIEVHEVCSTSQTSFLVPWLGIFLCFYPISGNTACRNHKHLELNQFSFYSRHGNVFCCFRHYRKFRRLLFTNLRASPIQSFLPTTPGKFVS